MFDNQYWSTGTGNIYTAASTGANVPKLVESPLTTSGFTSSTGPCAAHAGNPPNGTLLQCANTVYKPITSAAATDSPVTEIYNTNTSIDWIFLSVSGSSSISGVSGCATGNGCAYSWNATSTLGTSPAPSAGLLAAGGTSGMIIDNTLGTTGASQIYFTPLAGAASGNLSSSSGAMTAGQTTATLSSASTFSNGDYIVIDAEGMQITAGGGTTSLTVTRGLLGTAATTHANSAAVNEVGAAVQAAQSGL
jgi:hypothetical protein